MRKSSLVDGRPTSPADASTHDPQRRPPVAEQQAKILAQRAIAATLSKGDDVAIESVLQSLLADFNALNANGRDFLMHEQRGLAALCSLFAQKAQMGELGFRTALEDLANLVAGQSADAVSILSPEAMTLMVRAFSSVAESAPCVRVVEHLKRHECKRAVNTS